MNTHTHTHAHARTIKTQSLHLSLIHCFSPSGSNGSAFLYSWFSRFFLPALPVYICCTCPQSAWCLIPLVPEFQQKKSSRGIVKTKSETPDLGYHLEDMRTFMLVGGKASGFGSSEGTKGFQWSCLGYKNGGWRRENQACWVHHSLEKFLVTDL